MSYRATCRTELEVMGAFRSPWLRPAFGAVDREAFVPDQFWGYETDENGLHRVFDKHDDFDAWQREVWNTHRSLIMQIDDKVTADQGPAKGDFSSSISALDIVFEKLVQLEVASGHRVLHIGTASGYDSALLCEVVSSANLTTIEFDSDLAARGKTNLEAAGYRPTTLCGDGLVGYAAGAPYDRIIATAAVRDIPTRWREQAKDGAIVLAPFNTLFARGGLLKLTVQGGVASGRFVGGACYMWARQHRPNNEINAGSQSRKTASPVDPHEVVGVGWPSQFVIGLHVPDVFFAERGEGESRQVQFWDEAGTSVAIVNFHDWWDRDAVTLYGPRDLWNEVVEAFSTWRHLGQPHYTRFGLTFDTAGRRLWLDDPANVVQD